MATEDTLMGRYALSLLLPLIILTAAVLATSLGKPKNPRLPRIGIDPGPSNRNLAAAKKLFSTEGYRLLDAAYRKVGSPFVSLYELWAPS